FTQRGQHFGSRIAIAPDGNLFVTLGERGEMDRAQDINDLAGGVVRIRPDGSIPSDNPFVGRDGADEFWSVGHRNPQGAAIRPSDGSLWTVEHAAMGGDEVNRPLKGLNYGWPVITYGRNYGGEKIGVGTEAPGYEQPVHYWDPSIAPSGMAFYDGDLFPEWQGDLLVGALKFELLVRLELDGDKVVAEERLVAGAFGRIRDVRAGPDGAIYLVTDEDPGVVVRIAPSGQ
ncbi:MAG: PQQ-dependent sugar dehydrogenase, partial [Cucumibacter sp.]